MSETDTTIALKSCGQVGEVAILDVIPQINGKL